MSEYYGLNSVKDAREYYKNKQLRKNLNDCLSIIYKYKNKEEVVSCLGKLDTMKLHSCVSLFYLATKKNIFKRFVKKFFNSILDKKTILLLEIGVQWLMEGNSIAGIVKHKDKVDKVLKQLGLTQEDIEEEKDKNKEKND